MIYPEKFVTAALIKMDSDELSAMADSLWADWQRVNDAFKVVKDMEQQKDLYFYEDVEDLKCLKENEP